MIKSIKIDPNLCKKCGVCKKHCPVGAIEGKVKEAFNIDADKCIKCGVCIMQCKFNAIVQSPIEAETVTYCAICSEPIDLASYNYIATKIDVGHSIYKMCPECRTHEIARRLSAIRINSYSL